MILVRTYNGGSLSFRTQRGTVQAKMKNGFMYVDVGPIVGKHMQLLHAFHKPPAGFSLGTPEKEVKKKSPVARKKTSAKKTITKKKSTAKK